MPVTHAVESDASNEVALRGFRKKLDRYEKEHAAALTALKRLEKHAREMKTAFNHFSGKRISSKSPKRRAGASRPLQFYEKVMVNAKGPQGEKITDELGAILGRSRGKQGWIYAVRLYGSGRVLNLQSKQITPTGQRDRRETFYSGSIRVRVAANGNGTQVGSNGAARHGKS